MNGKRYTVYDAGDDAGAGEDGRRRPGRGKAMGRRPSASTARLGSGAGARSGKVGQLPAQQRATRPSSHPQVTATGAAGGASAAGADGSSQSLSRPLPPRQVYARPRRRWPLVLGIVTLVVFAGLCGVGGYFFGVVQAAADTMQDNYKKIVGDVNIKLATATGSEAQNILLIGSDRREKSVEGQDDPGRSDTMMLLRLDPNSGSISMLSIPRDLWVEIPGYGMDRMNTSYTLGARVYDYDVTYQGISPYVHGEISPVDKLRITAGLRYDRVSYKFDNRFGTTPILASGSYYGQVGDTDVDFGHLSPKLGATYMFSEALNVFAAYNHAFRAPSEGQLFRPAVAGSAGAATAAAEASANLKPIKVDSFEIGLRGKLNAAINYDIAAYTMTKKDDILSYRDPVSNLSTPTNAGKTLHRGIEIGAGAQLAELWRLDTAFSYTKHTYEDWIVATQGGNVSYSGKEMELAPRRIANTRLSFGNAQTGMAQLEWLHFGSWWSNAANTSKYDGHDLFNLRGIYPLGRDISLFANIHNLADKRYAESTGVTSGFDTFAPGLPRTFSAGLQAKW